MYNIEYLLFDLKQTVKKYMMRRRKAIHRGDLLHMINRRLKIQYKLLDELLSHVLIELHREGVITFDDEYIRPVKNQNHKEIPLWRF